MPKKKEPSIKLSEKHGLNPTLGVCLYCGQETGEIGLLGKLKGDKEAPKFAVLNYDPCKKCKKQWDKGYTLIGCTEEKPEDGRPPIHKNPEMYPTGKFIVVTKEYAESAGFPSEGNFCLAPQELLDDIVNHAQKNASSIN